MNQVGFGTAVGILLSNSFERFAVRVQSLSEAVILAPRWILPVGSDISRAKLGRKELY
jgi:hypothetical protein